MSAQGVRNGDVLSRSCLRPYEVHGVEFVKSRGDEAEGHCPLCAGEHKFHVNTVQEVWHCKKCGQGGGLAQFLACVVEENTACLAKERSLLEQLAQHRGLPADAFSDQDVGLSGLTYTIAVRDTAGRVVDVVRWAPGGKPHSTPECHTGLYGAHRLNDDPDAPVFVAEGPWDAIALRHLLREAGEPGVVVAVPGAGSFKTEWAKALVGRKVLLLYDNDEAGEKGELRAYQRLQGLASEISFIRWPNDMPVGYDASDWVARWREDGDFERGMRVLLDSAHEEPRLGFEAVAGHAGEVIAGQDGENTHIGRLMKLVEGLDIVKAQDGTPYATVELQPGVRATLGVRSSEFRAWLARSYYAASRRVAPASTIKDLAEFLAGQAALDAREDDVFVRVGGRDQEIYLDIVDAKRRAVRINSAGWRIVRPKRVRFARSPTAQPLPSPKSGGNLERLRQVMNLESDVDWALLLGWTIAALRPTGPYPLLVLKGEQGSAKSMTTRILRALIDPSGSPAVALPSKLEDLAVLARSTWVLAFDNVSTIKPAVSDALCRLSTGGGFVVRRMYTNDELFSFQATRPIILNGIDDLTTRADLAERAILVELPPIPERARRTEEELWIEFHDLHAGLLGVLCDALSVAVRRWPSIALDRMPRMADAVKWMVAAEEALGLREGAILDAYGVNLARANQAPLNAAPIVEPLEDLLDANGGSWSGTPNGLLLELEATVAGRRVGAAGWPSSASVMSKALKRLAPSLRSVGIEVRVGERTAGGKSRIISLRRLGSAREPEKRTGPRRVERKKKRR